MRCGAQPTKDFLRIATNAVSQTMKRSGERKRSGIRRALSPRVCAAWAVLACSSFWVFPAASSLASPTRSFEFVRDFGPVRFAALIPDERRRLLFAIENLVDGTNVTLRFHILDQGLGTLAILNVNGRASGTGFAQDPVVHAFDERRGILRLVAYPSLRHRESAADTRLLTIEVVDPQKPVLLSDRVLAAFPPGTRPLGMSVARRGGHEIVFFIGQAPSRTDVTVRAYGALVAEVSDTAGGPVVAPNRLTGVPGCQRVIADTRQAVVESVAGTVWIACGPTSVSENSTPSPASVQAVDLSDPARARSYFLPGTYGKGESFFDPNAGALGRLVVAGSAALRPGQAVWVFDVEHRAFVGQVAADDISGVALDTRTGRIFVASGKRVLIGSDRGEPLPQALPPIRILGSVSGAVTVVPFNRWVIIPSERSVGTQSFYAVYADRTTKSDLPQGSLTDFRQQDMETTPESAQNFNGNTQAFGMRVRMIGGATNVQVNRLGGSKSFWYEPTRGVAPSPRDASGLEDGDRDLYFARVNGAELSADAASAGAISADRDDRTTIDYRNKVGEWPAGPARCLDFGDRASSGVGENGAWASGWAPPTAACDVAGGRTEARAESEATRVEDVVTVASSAAHVTLTRLAGGGVRVVAHAEARDVTIGGVVHIGTIASDSVVEAFGGRVTAKGRSAGRARATYVRTFEYVSGHGSNLPGGDFSCRRATDGASAAQGACDVSEVVQLLTSVLGTQVQAELPGREELATPGGAHAHAWRDPWALIQDSLMNGQLITEAQVPALRISFIADGDVPSRVLVDLAATKADATSIALAEEQAPTADPPLPALRPVPSLRPVAGPRVDVDITLAPKTRPPGSPRVVEFGWGILFGRDPAGFVLSALLWALFVSPPFLAVRRRYLKAVARIGVER